MAERQFGHIEGTFVGQIFANRAELSFSKIHRPMQAGISGGQKEGADSIVISGGYEDDKDFGDVIIYTGHGGRDIDSKKQTTDQELTRQNLALAVSCQNGLPVRVIRGRHKSSEFAPDEGYRYDGLYRIEEYSKKKGKSGYAIWLFTLRKINNESYTDSTIVKEDPEDYKTPKRINSNIQRIVRDTKLSKKVKELYNHKCQVCGTAIETNAGLYAEAAHIKPLGAPHNGPDTLDNLICLCPNHHVMFDFGGFSILEDFDLIGIHGRLKVNKIHKINSEFLKYHLEHFYDEKNR